MNPTTSKWSAWVSLPKCVRFAVLGFIWVAGTAALAQTSSPSSPAYYRIRNAGTGAYINIEYGLAAGPVGEQWWSSHWQLESAGDYHLRIRNRWKPTQVLQTETGVLSIGGAGGDSLTSHWRFQINPDGTLWIYDRSYQQTLAVVEGVVRIVFLPGNPYLANVKVALWNIERVNPTLYGQTLSDQSGVELQHSPGTTYERVVAGYVNPAPAQPLRATGGCDTANDVTGVGAPCKSCQLRHSKVGETSWLVLQRCKSAHCTKHSCVLITDAQTGGEQRSFQPGGPLAIVSASRTG
jgi:hypothetical protein